MGKVTILAEGYSRDVGDIFESNCTCVLITGHDNIIVDTMTSWDGPLILNELKKNNVEPKDISWVVSTHGHSDHVGNNNLFLNATHIVGTNVSKKDNYFYTDLLNGKDHKINEEVKVIYTPGHTCSDVTVLVETDQGTVAIAGDIFEKEEDIADPSLWKELALSANPSLQSRSRSRIADLAAFIIPGHGPMFRVTEAIRDTIRKQIIPPEDTKN